MSEKRYDIDVSRYAGHTPGSWIEQWEGEPLRHPYVVWSTRMSTFDGERYIYDPVALYVSRKQDASLIADAPKLLDAYQAQAERIAELEAENERLRRVITQALEIANSITS